MKKSKAILEIQLYANLMNEVKWRIAVVDHFLTGKGNALFEASTIECVCLQIRKVLELVAFGSLIANKAVYSAVRQDFATDWNAPRLLLTLEQVNPNFYPISCKVQDDLEIPGVVQYVAISEGFLTKKTFVKVYEKCGAMMHARNPFSRPLDVQFYKKSVSSWRDQIIRLLDCHEVHFVGGQIVWVFQMNAAGGVLYETFDLKNTLTPAEAKARLSKVPTA